MSEKYEINKNIPLTQATPSALQAADANHISSSDATLGASRSVSLADQDANDSKALSDTTSTRSKAFSKFDGLELIEPCLGIHELDKSNVPTVAPAPGKPEDVVAIPLTRLRFWLLFISLCICVFLFALDQLILATAIPKITDEFGALDQLPWLANG